MKINNNIQNEIDSTFKVIDSIETVNVSPFFKDKTMNVLFAEAKVEQTVWTRFLPKLQLATLACVVLLNVIVFTKYQHSSSYKDNVNEFAESYGLLTSYDDITILNEL